MHSIRWTVANAAMDLGVDTEQIDIIDSVPDAVARALEVTPADGQVIVTGFALHGWRGPLGAGAGRLRPVPSARRGAGNVPDS